MKPTTQNLLLIALLAVTTLPSCKKNEDNPSVVNEITDVDKSGVSMFSALRFTPQTFNVTAGVSTKIKGTQGTIIEFYPNSFKDKTGHIISSGTVNIQLTEMYSVGDMLANRTTTATSSGLLTSGGEVNIKATSGGQEVFANKYRIGFKALTPAQSKPMELYNGDAGNADSITFWGITKSFSPGTAYITDTTWRLMEMPYYMFDSCSSFNMINCDHPYDSTSKDATISVVFPDNTFKSTFASLGVVYPSLHVATILNSYQFNSDTHTMTFKGWVPTGTTGKFVLMIPKTTSNWYYYEQSATITGDMSINATVIPASTAEVLSKLQAL